MGCEATKFANTNVIAHPAQTSVGGLSESERADSAVYLSEALSQINEGASFLDRLALEEIDGLRRISSRIVTEPGESIFMQGDVHSGIFLIESGRVRTFYAGPSGKEITLAYWTPGHFIGGPDVFGGSVHIWSATAVEQSKLAYLPGPKLRHLAETMPSVALALIDGLVSKGKCYSALVQMLGTRSVTERLAQLLLILASVNGQGSGSQMIVDRRITREQLAAIVGSTRQWVTSTLSRFRVAGCITIDKGAIIINDPDRLRLEV